MKLSPDEAVRYLIKESEKIRGPFLTDGLESLVYLGQITPDTLISREGEQRFVPIKDTPLRSSLFPKLVVVDGPAGWGKPGSAAVTLAARPLRFTEPKFERVNSLPGLGRKVEVTELLDEVRRMERNAGLDLARPSRFKISRRTKDFWLMLVLGNGLLLGGGIAMQSLTSLVFAIGGMGLFTFGLLWSMFGVMGKY
ncbi:MAG: hypothetical protein C0518_05690 [Opitutus sp.]|nr:hypothetical protein [Opitutus sp.]